MSIQASIGISITLFLCIMGIFDDGNKRLHKLMFIWMIVIICCNTGGSDWNNNYNIYRDASIKSLNGINLLSFGYIWICFLSKQAGISFETLHFILAFISSCLIYRVILKYSKRPSFTLALLYLYPLVDNVIQKRWYYAMGIIIAGLPILWNEANRKRKWVKFGLVCLLASQFHIATLFYILLLVFEFVPEKSKKKAMVLCFIAEFFSIKFLPRFLLNINLFSSKVNLYFIEFAENSSLVKMMFWTIWHFAVIFGMLYFLKQDKTGIYYRDASNEKFEKGLSALNFFSMVIIPFYSFDPVFTRMFRPIIILDYIFVSNHIYNRKFVYTKKGFYNLGIGVSIALSTSIIFYFLTGVGFNKLVIPIFENNSFINKIFSSLQLL